jgi:hypothetical protein
MRRGSGWAPSIAPKGDDRNVYLVVMTLGGSAGCTERPTLKPRT